MHPKGRKTNAQTNGWWNLGVVLAALVTLVAMTAIFLYFLEWPATEHPSAHKDASTPSPRSPHSVLAGDPVIVGDLEDDNPELPICLIIDIRDVDAVATLVRNRDEAGMLKLVQTRRAIFVDNRTPAVFLERGPKLCRVRIVSGGQRGKEAWIPPDFLLRELLPAPRLDP